MIYISHMEKEIRKLLGNKYMTVNIVGSKEDIQNFYWWYNIHDDIEGMVRYICCGNHKCELFADGKWIIGKIQSFLVNNELKNLGLYYCKR